METERGGRLRGRQVVVTEAFKMLMREQAEAEHGYGTPAYYTACSY